MKPAKDYPFPFPFSSWRRLRLVLPASFLACGLSGCLGLGVPIAQWRAANDKNLTPKITKAESDTAVSTKIEEPRNLIGRWLNPKGSNAPETDDKSKIASANSSDTLIHGSDGWRPMLKPKPNPEADNELDAAKALFAEKKFAEAEAAFARLAKSRKGSHWGEKGQYYLAECQYQQKKYVKANDSFEKLFAEYPGTEFLDQLVSREYALAQIWLGEYGGGSGPDNTKDKVKAKDKPENIPQESIPWYASFTGERPLIDAQGTALKALEHVRHHDPKGQLADDAALQIADYHMKVQDYESAAIYYDQLIELYPNSPFLQQAQLAAIDARMKAYLGPDYDSSGLDKARELVKQTMSTFPDRQASYEGLYHTLDLINDQDAEKTFRTGAYYKKLGKVPSAEYYFGKIPQRWPNSPWAVKAKTELAQLAKMPRTESLPSKIMGQPGQSDPYFSAGPGGGAMGGMGGMGMPGGMN